MSGAFQLVTSFLVLAVLAAPVAGICVSLIEPDDPCEMQETPEMASCSHGEMVMSGCCSFESAEPLAEAILPGHAGDIDLPATSGNGVIAPALDGVRAAVLACDADPPPTIPRYTLFSSLLL